MADTAIKDEEEKKEYFDSPDVLDKKIDQLANLVLKAKHFIAFTGAGISTSAGIPDYRSGINTVLPTGPGCWEKKAQHIKSQKAKLRTSMQSAIPTPTHMALNELCSSGYLKFLISQNVDGLHRRSGFPGKYMSELHGNTNLEYCKKCGKEYLRDFRCRTAAKVHDHETGRKCHCGGKLCDSIINFGENLRAKDIDAGFEHSEMADLCLAMGSSLRVTPAADMPAVVGKKKDASLVIVNLQKTPLDSLAAIKINALCDKVMEMLCEKLKLKIPEFVLQRQVRVLKSSKQTISVQGIDLDGLPYSLFKEVSFDVNGKEQCKLTKEPFQIQCKGDISKGYAVVDMVF